MEVAVLASIRLAHSVDNFHLCGVVFRSFVVGFAQMVCHDHSVDRLVSLVGHRLVRVWIFRLLLT